LSWREKIIEKIHDMPPLPASAMEIVRLMQDPQVSFNKISQTIEYDPSMTTNVLKLANSVFMSGYGKIVSVKEASVRLGLDTVFSLVVASSVSPIVEKEVTGYGLGKGALWRHSVAVAECSKVLGNALGIAIPKHTFTSGLLHDIGKVVLGQFLEIEGKKITSLSSEKGIPFEAAEREFLGTDHAEVGAELLASWNIPSNVVDVVRWHHAPEELKTNTVVVDLVHLSDSLCINLGLDTGVDELNYKVSEEAILRTGFTLAIAEKVTSMILDAMEDISELVKFPTEG
jgi:putative nucleotidyltransferase with HDIG domain